MDLNKIQLIGRLSADPETGVSEKHMPNAVMLIQTERVWKDRTTGATERAADTHRVFAVGRLAEVILKYLKKGDRVYVDGSLRSAERTKSIGLVAQNLIMLGGGKREPKNDDIVEEEIDVKDGAGV